ncbi:MAG: nicotinamide-nucleotide amidohydrolase family protein, partial [Thalassolituus sp.]|uniref:nicotinamide-nucleotide amidohydrolase family protein n=1 Tax=Thalassolituus sp. TaxID=2030822 RepID=UPI003982D3A7
DHNAIINESQKILKSNFDFLFVTGGLGPTHDDVTKKAFCKLLSDEMYLDENYFALLKKKFESHFKNMPEINRNQAMILKKAEVIPNDSGSALGMYYLEDDTHVFIMPGVPGEMKEMVQNYIIPNYLKNEPVNNQVTIKTAGIMESRLAEKTEQLMKKHSDTFNFAFLPHYTGVSFRIRQRDASDNLQKIQAEFFKVMQPYAYGFDDDSLEGVLAERLIYKNLTIATAESCTGGLIGKRLTDVAGSSKYFLGSITAYSNKLKTALLDVSEGTLAAHGAVSEKVAFEMAAGIRNNTDADIGISTTGISGPDGGSESKPLGLVYIGVVTPDISKVKKYIFPVKRHIHREMTATAALNITRLALEK